MGHLSFSLLSSKIGEISQPSLECAQPENGNPRQVGFLWAPNWTLVFLAVLPLYLGYLVELLRYWKEEWKPELLSSIGSDPSLVPWAVRTVRLGPSLWMIFVVTVVVASAFNWTASHLLPLLERDAGSWPVDWGRIAIVHPEIVSVQATLIFSALVFLYNGFTAYLFFAGLAILLLIKDDLVGTLRAYEARQDHSLTKEVQTAAHGFSYGLYRCTTLGVTITIMMKLQSGFLGSGSPNIVAWLRDDALLALGQTVDKEPSTLVQVSSPGSIYSLLCLIAIVGTFLVSQIQITSELNRLGSITAQTLHIPIAKMNAGMACLVVGYLSIGLLPGFSILVASSLLVGCLFMIEPKSRKTKLSRRGT